MLNQNDAAVLETHVLLKKVNDGLYSLEKAPVWEKADKAVYLISNMRDLLAKLVIENHRLSNDIERLKGGRNG